LVLFLGGLSCRVVKARLVRHILIALVASVVLCVTGYADTHYVNPAGSNEPPYTTYATGAHYIQDAILVASEGDTVRVAAGEYDIDTTIYIPSGLIWAGAGRDSVVINWADPEYRPGRLAELGKNIEIFGIEFNFPMGSSFNPTVMAIYVYKPDTLIIHDCRFREIRAVIDGSGVLEAYENEFIFGITEGLHLGIGQAWIHHNSFLGKTAGAGIRCMLAGSILVEHNVFNEDPIGRPDAVRLYHATFVEVRNNLILNSHNPVAWFYASGVVENNTMIVASDGGGSIPVFLRSYETVTIRNNIMMEFRELPAFGPECPTCDTTGLITYVHNAFWPPVDSFYIIDQYDPPELVKVLDSANFNAFPMFADDSIFQLQAGSPLIDAGDPAVLDADGSRSDIGLTGGPGGMTYDYPEEAPQRPDTLTGEHSDDVVILAWLPNSESDLADYRLYRDTYSGFTPHAGNLLAAVNPEDTTYVDSIEGLNWDLYYILTTVDTAGLESGPSNEVAVLWTGILEEEEPSHSLPRTPYIVGNYPNPFNASTIIEYYIPDVGARPALVQLVIYDAMGRKVSTLVNRKLYPGKHRVSWGGRTDSGNVAASGVYFARLNVWGYEFRSSVKLVLQK